MSAGRPNPYPPLIGHRGARKHAPENTLAGLRCAADFGVSWVEFDVKLSRDGVALLMHDETLERTTNGRGRVADTAWSTIAALDAGARFGPRFVGERVPTLAQTVELLDELGLGANVEIKPCPGREVETGRLVATELARLWPARLPAPVLSSFSEAALEAARAAAPQLARGLLVGALPLDWQARAERLGCIAVHCGARELTAEQVRAVKQAGYPLLVYTVNDAAQAAQLRAWGVDSLVTDDPPALSA
ncbi:MAG: glycerophosphodiester phosphodiesterase [Planctomycetota bacterium]